MQGGLHVLWDLESVLLDYWPAVEGAMRRTVDAHGDKGAADQPLDWLLSVPLREALAVLLHSQDQAQLDAAEQTYQQQYALHAHAEARLRPGAEALLDFTSQQKGVEAHWYTHIGQQAVNRLIAEKSMSGRIRKVYTGDRCLCAGVRPQILDVAQQAVAEYRPAHVLLVAEDPRELFLARRWGLSTLGLSYARFSEHSVRRGGPQWMARNPAEVLHKLAGLAAALGHSPQQRLH